MHKIAVFVNENLELCDFFDAERFVFYGKCQSGWTKISDSGFKKVKPATPAETRKNTEILLPLINAENCGILAGGALLGIPFSVFDRAGLKIFSISEISDDIFDDIISEILQIENERVLKESAVRDAVPKETDTKGVYCLDLVALQREYPEVTSKQAMRQFLESTPFTELHLKCRHIPPWIENDGRFDIRITSVGSADTEAVITKKE